METPQDASTYNPYAAVMAQLDRAAGIIGLEDSYRADPGSTRTRTDRLRPSRDGRRPD